MASALIVQLVCCGESDTPRRTRSSAPAARSFQGTAESSHGAVLEVQITTSSG